MNIIKKTKGFLLLISLLFCVVSSGFSQSRGVWKGDKITFKKTDYATWTNSSSQDRITDSVWITRKNDQGIFNIKVSGGYTYNTSPRGTKWAYGTTSSTSLVFRDWETAVGNYPPGMVNRDMVMLILKDSIMIDIKFTSWTQGGSGGGFSYIRSTDCRSFTDVTKAICDSFVSPSKKYVWKKSGTYYDTLVNTNKCDSILKIKLTIYGQDTGKIYISGCGQVIMPISKRVVKTTGIHYDTLKNGTICGRDSILVANIYIYQSPTKSMTASACDSFITPTKKTVLKASGVYYEVLKAYGTCDTILTINLTIYPSSVTKITEVTCDRFVSSTGKIYTKTGNYLDTLLTSFGCDSIIDLDLTINKSKLTKWTPIVCKVSYKSPSGKYAWGKSGKYYDTLSTSAGCDSIIEIDLVVQPNTEYLVVKSCSPFISPSGKYIYDKTGIYMDTLAASKSCDSLVTIDYVKLEPTSSTINVLAAINRYHAPSGKYVWGTNGKYQDTIPNKAGCDSVITFNLTINNISKDVTQNGNDLTAVATGVNYQWLDCNRAFLPIVGATSQTFTVAKKGRYAVTLSNEWNADTSACVSMNLSVGNYENPYGIQLYPNPNNGNFTLDLGSAPQEVTSVQVFNSTGKLVYENFNTSELMDMNLTNEVTTGIYFVRVIGRSFSYNVSLLIR